MSVMFINSRKIEVPNGANVSVINNEVYVNGKPWVDKGSMSDIAKENLQITIKIEGNVGNVTTNGLVEVNGNVNGNVEAHADVICGDVTGNVEAGNGVTVKGNVQKNIDAGNYVKVSGDVYGDIDAGSFVKVNGQRKSHEDLEKDDDFDYEP